MGRQVGTRQRPKEARRAANAAVPVAVVGAALTAVLMVLLLLSQSRLSRLGFEISALEQELEREKDLQDRLQVSYGQAYSLTRVEQYAIEKLGMMHPHPDQYRVIDIETADTVPRETEASCR